MVKKSNLTPNKLLRAQRRRRNWTQAQLAEMIGTTPFNVSRWERGETVPSLYFRQRLCEVFQLSAEELGLSEEEDTADASSQSTSEPSASEIQPEQPPRRSIWQRIFLISLILAIAILALIALRTYLVVKSPPPHVVVHIIPGGSWISPMDRQIVHDMLHFAAYGYPTHSGEPEIDHVNFTMWWQGIDPRTWLVACTLYSHTAKNVFMCDVNLRLLGAPAGQIRISFDVFDRMGNTNLAPNGVHTIMYVPSFP